LFGKRLRLGLIVGVQVDAGRRHLDAALHRRARADGWSRQRAGAAARRSLTPDHLCVRTQAQLAMSAIE
jgi:hypothetical protein